MKRILKTFAATAASFVALTGFAGGNHGGGNSSAPVVHSGSSAPAPAAAAPHVSGVPHSGNGVPQHYVGQMPYRATVTYRNGNKTLSYPAVGISNGVHHSTHSNLSSANNARSIHNTRATGNLQGTALKAQRRAGGNSQHAAAVILSAKHKLNPQTAARLRNWSGNPVSTAQAHQNNINNHHHHHGHDWWHHHCAAIIFWDWGWWGWWDGWWYPAWGYYPDSYYSYDEPIYGYGGLSPEQIVAGVQVALQDEGYYTYAIDGQMGPLTRSAIGRYQRDHRLPITYEIDQATLGSLGIIH